MNRRIAQIAARQHGVVSSRQLGAAGLGRSAISYRVGCGLLTRLHRGVYAVGCGPVGREGRWMAAALAYGPRAALSFASALELWEVRPSASGWTDVSVPTRGGLAPRRGIRLHRCPSLSPAELTTHRRVPVTTLARTLLDVAAGFGPTRLLRCIERAEVLGLFDLGALQRILERHPSHVGAVPLSHVLSRYGDDEPTRSELEAMLVDLCDRSGVARPLVNRVVESLEVDFLWPRERLVVETDGHRTHGTRAAFERDRARDARLAVAGYRVLRFTYRQLCEDPAQVARTIAAVLAATDGWAVGTERARSP